jgi:hypothetical protein
MSKKPTLSLVEPSHLTATAPPKNLGKPGRTLWQSLMSEYDIADSGGLAMLEQACAAINRISEYGAAIDRDGPVLRTKQGPKEHPLLKHELAARSFVVRTLARLGLDVEPIRSIRRPARPTDC